MSLLKKALNDPKPAESASLLARALASSQEEPRDVIGAASSDEDSWDSESIDSFLEKLESLGPSPDNILSVWEICLQHLKLSALAIFSKSGDFLELAAASGFPAPSPSAIPLSAAPGPKDDGFPLGSESLALVATSLGVNAATSLRAVAIRSVTEIRGLWVYYDPRLEDNQAMSEDIVCALSGCSEHVELFPIEKKNDSCQKILEGGARRFPKVCYVSFDLEPCLAAPGLVPGLGRSTLSSLFLAALQTILASNGQAQLYSSSKVLCFVGNTGDQELVLFQLGKVLRKALPQLHSLAAPKIAALSLVPADTAASQELSRFLQA